MHADNLRDVILAFEKDLNADQREKFASILKTLVGCSIQVGISNPCINNMMNISKLFMFTYDLIGSIHVPMETTPFNTFAEALDDLRRIKRSNVN